MLDMTQSAHIAEPTAWVPDDGSFGARLALLRQGLGWNMTEAARECKITPENWRLWEEGRKPRDLEVVAKAIANRTGCDLHWLILGPSRAMLATRAQATACYDRMPDWSRVAEAAHPVRVTDAVSVNPTRAVEQTRPIPRPRRAVPLLAHGLIG